MLYVVTFVRDGKLESHVGTRAQCQALADYMTKTFRVSAEVKVA
jgi:hypothetical protein